MNMSSIKRFGLTALALSGLAVAQSDYLPFPRSSWPAGIQTAWQIQGEYFGITSTGQRLGAWVVSRNQSTSGTTPNRYGVVFLPGGLLTLPGDTLYGGWNQTTRWQGSGTGSAGIMITTLADGKNFTLGTSGTAPATTTTGGVTLDSVTGSGENRFLHGRISTGTPATFILQRVTRQSPTANLKPLPEWGAVSWFDTSTAQADLSKWQSQDNAPSLYQSKFLLRGSKTTNANIHGRGYLHIEFMTSFNPAQTGQNRSNSGVYLQGKYEVQVLDSYGLAGLNDEFGGIYTVRAADVNASLPPNTWHTYDVYFTPRTSGSAGQTAGAAYMTVYANGVLTQDSIPVPSVTTAGLSGDMLLNAPLYLQNHGSNVIYRNIWFIPNATVQSHPWSSILAAALPTSIRSGALPTPGGARSGKAPALGFGGDYDLIGRKLGVDATKKAVQPTVHVGAETDK